MIESEEERAAYLALDLAIQQVASVADMARPDEQITQWALVGYAASPEISDRSAYILLTTNDALPSHVVHGLFDMGREIVQAGPLHPRDD